MKKNSLQNLISLFNYLFTMILSSKKKKKNGEDKIPEEIDDHFRLYGKAASDVEYGQRCPICNSRIDEFGYCACGAGRG